MWRNDTITGTFFIDATDFKMPDLQEEFVLKRHYASTNQEAGILGKGWTLNYISQLYQDGSRVYANLVTGHTVSFVNTEEGWQNVDGENGRFSLVRDDLRNEWQVKDCITHTSYIYNALGFMINIIDSNHQKTTFEYHEGHLQKITSALGYELSFLCLRFKWQ